MRLPVLIINHPAGGRNYFAGLELGFVLQGVGDQVLQFCGARNSSSTIHCAVRVSGFSRTPTFDGNPESLSCPCIFTSSGRNPCPGACGPGGTKVRPEAVDLEERVVPYLEAADLAGQLAGQAVHGPEVAALAMVPARAWRKSSAPVLRSRWRWARGFDLLCCAQEQQRLVALRFHPRQRQSQH